MENYTVLDIGNRMSVGYSCTTEVTPDEFVAYINDLSQVRTNTYFRVNEVYKINDEFKSKDYVIRNLESSLEDEIICTLDEDYKMLHELEYCLLSALVADDLRFFIFSDDRMANDILEIVTNSGALIIIQTVS